LYLVPIAGAFIYWQQGGLSLFAILVLAIFCLFVLGRNALVLCRIQVSDQNISIRFLLPVRSGGTFSHDEIESYAELSANLNENALPIAGFLKPKNQKRIMLMDAGTKNFAELNAVLKEIYPNAKPM
jgi:hypothetical protein